jgi:hypothetical protein
MIKTAELGTAGNQSFLNTQMEMESSGNVTFFGNVTSPGFGFLTPLYEIHKGITKNITIMKTAVATCDITIEGGIITNTTC